MGRAGAGNDRPAGGARKGVVRRIDASFETVTPAHVGGAPDGVARPAEVRVPSLLGVLRFWWRALEWGRALAEAPAAAAGPWHQRYVQPLQCLRQREDRLFGAAGTGQGLILASLGTVSRPNPNVPQRGAAYLAGQGLKDRDAVGAGSVFTLRLVVRRRKPETAGDAELASITRALRCLGMLGGFGARSRRGFGSLVLRRITDSEGRLDWQQPSDLDAYRAELASLNDGTWTTREPPFTAFSAGSRLMLIPAGAGAFLEQGLLFQRYRSKGARDDDDPLGPHKIAGLPVNLATHRFRGDFAWFDDLLAQGRARKGPERAMFGLPHNYFSKGRGKAEIVASIPEAASRRARSDRRASPLFLHIHKLGDGQLIAAWLFLPALFLPPIGTQGPQLRVTVGRRDALAVNYSPSWAPITDFYGELAKQPGCVAVWP